MLDVELCRLNNQQSAALLPVPLCMNSPTIKSKRVKSSTPARKAGAPRLVGKQPASSGFAPKLRGIIKADPLLSTKEGFGE